MARRDLLMALVVAMVGILFVMAGVVSAPLQDAVPFTPTAFNYVPAVFKNYQLPTPTFTPTATATPTSTPTSTPTLPPPSFDGCQEDPDPGSAGNYPVRIVTVYKAANPEVVRLQNVSAWAVDLTGWHVCSINGNQEHDGIGGALSPGEVRDFPYTDVGFIWNNSERDDGALYNASGQLVSYWVDQ